MIIGGINIPRKRFGPLLYCATTQSSRRGLSARLRGHSDIADNPDFVRRRKAQVLQPVQHYDFLSLKYFFPIHEDWGNNKKSTQPVDFSQKEKRNPVYRPPMAAGTMK
jgi:hypothetical protein